MKRHKRAYCSVKETLVDNRQGAMQDLNDLYFFSAVVEHGGFSAAGRALGVPKSRLSKRVAQLEERLGVRLLQRTTRRFVVTDVGERFNAHCRAVLEEAQAAQDAIDELSSEPRGVVRVTCPVSLSQTVMAELLPEFMTQYPKVQVRLQSSNRRVDLLGEGVDIAIRVRSRLDADATLVMRGFGESSLLAVASPALLDAKGRPDTPESLSTLPALSMYEHEAPQVWTLVDKGGTRIDVPMQARLISGEFPVLLEAARAGLGVALMPGWICAPAIAEGSLEVVLPEWSTPPSSMHFVYSSRRGLLPGVRALVDFLGERLPQAVERNHMDCTGRSDGSVTS
jgi:DNA-binding transcriptional LysR family regulator